MFYGKTIFPSIASKLSIGFNILSSCFHYFINSFKCNLDFFFVPRIILIFVLNFPISFGFRINFCSKLVSLDILFSIYAVIFIQIHISFQILIVVC